MTAPHALGETAAAPSRAPETSGNDVRRGLWFGLITALCGGVYFTFARSGIVGGLGPADLTLCRFGIAGLILSPVLLRRRLAGIGWRRALVLTVFGGPAFAFLQAEGFRYAPLSHGAIIAPAAVTLGSILLTTTMLSERLGWLRFAGVVVVLVGLGLIGAESVGTIGGAELWLGDLLFVAAGLVWAVYTVLLKVWSVEPTHGTATVNVLGFVVILAGYQAWIGLGHVARIDAASLVLQGVVQGVIAGVALLLAYSRCIALLGPSRAALFPSMVPVIAALLGVPVLGEIPTPVQIVGLVLVTIGLFLAIGVIPRLRIR